METNKYISLDNLTTFLDNLKDTFETAEDLDIIESLALVNKAAIEANASALKTMQTDIDALAKQVRLNEENLANFVAVSSQEIGTLF